MDAAIFCERSVPLFQPNLRRTSIFNSEYFSFVTKHLRFKSKCSSTFLGMDIKIVS